jgi:hypothetical protein
LFQGGRRDRREQPALSTSTMAGEFSVRNTSAGEAAPSCTSWLPISVSSPLRMVTGIPVSWVNLRPTPWSGFRAARCKPRYRLVAAYMAGADQGGGQQGFLTNEGRRVVMRWRSGLMAAREIRRGRLD